MSGRRVLRAVVPAVVCVMTLSQAHADGPHIVLNATAGAYQVTVFSAPDPLATGPVELTALVQDARTGALLAPVVVTGELAPEPDPGRRAAIPLTLTVAGSSNHQLPGETVRVAAAGVYRLRLRIQAGGRPPQIFAAVFPVVKNQGRRNTLLWAVFLLAGVIVLFLANQGAKQRLREHQARQR